MQLLEEQDLRFSHTSISREMDEFVRVNASGD